MRLLKNILLVAAVLLVAASCEKSPIRHENLSGIPILLTASEVGGTRALLDAESFATDGNELQIYDYYTPVATEGSATPTPYFYIEDTVRSNGSSWPFVTGNNKPGKYEWTTDGVHKFFGWLVKDNNSPGITSQGFFDPDLEFNKTNHILTIPTTTLTQTGTQFDFMYSNIVTRDLDNQPDFSPVMMEFKHLFTAFKVTAANNSSNEIILKKVEITGLKNKRSAQINYSGDKPDIQYTYPSDTKASNFIYEVSDDGIELEKGEAPVELSNNEFKIMWPHSLADFADAEITVNYNYKEPNATSWNTDGQTKIKMADLTEWKAGEKNTLGLMFKDKEIKLTCIVEPWNVVEENIDFTDQISVSKPIEWEANTVEYVNYNTGEVILYSDDEIEAVCNFHIDTPSGATWTASLISVEGYSDAFEIVDGTKYGAVGVDSQIRIRVTNKAPIAPRHAVKLRITIQTADGRTIVADLMPKNNQNEGLKEYTIIQNLING